MGVDSKRMADSAADSAAERDAALAQTLAEANTTIMDQKAKLRESAAMQDQLTQQVNELDAVKAKLAELDAVKAKLAERESELERVKTQYEADVASAVEKEVTLKQPVLQHDPSLKLARKATGLQDPALTPRNENRLADRGRMAVAHWQSVVQSGKLVSSAAAQPESLAETIGSLGYKEQALIASCVTSERVCMQRAINDGALLARRHLDDPNVMADFQIAQLKREGEAIAERGARAARMREADKRLAEMYG